jgi:hypothetical protein
MCALIIASPPNGPVTKSLRAHALRRHARAFEQQEQFVRHHFRLRERDRSARLNQALALRDLERFDHAARRMVLIGQFDSGIRQRAAALVTASLLGSS